MHTYLIAEIGNNHQGDFYRAKEYIKAAANCGATHAKLQAYFPEDVSGSMHKGFYQKCFFSLGQFAELAEYAKEQKIRPLFSIFSKPMERLVDYCDGEIKISASQTSELIRKKMLQSFDDKSVYISFQDKIKVNMREAKCMAVTKYMSHEYDDFFLSNLSNIENHCDTFGISDHCLSIQPLLSQISRRKIKVVEKHFVLPVDKSNIYYAGNLFRDSVHAATPEQFEKIKLALEAKWNQ